MIIFLLLFLLQDALQVENLVVNFHVPDFKTQREDRCLTLSRGGRAAGDFEQQKTSTQNFIRESVQKVAQT